MKRRSVGQQLAKLRESKLRADDVEALATLRRKLDEAQARRAEALKQAAATCRRLRLSASAKIRAEREQAREALKRQANELRGKARAQCQARKYRIKRAGGAIVARDRAELTETRRLQAQLKRLATSASKRLRVSSAKERRQESDDYVRGNLPAELLPVWEAMKRTIKGGPRTTRTEAFLEWAEAHPDDVLSYQANDADRAVRELVREHEAAERRLFKAARPRKTVPKLGRPRTVLVLAG